MRRGYIGAVQQLDMIGFDAMPDRTFELPAGFTPSVIVEKRSVALPELVAAQVLPVPPGPTLPGLTQFGRRATRRSSAATTTASS